MLTFTYWTINLITTVIILFCFFLWGRLQGQMDFTNLVEEAKAMMREEFPVGVGAIFIIQTISWFVTKGILG